MIKKSILLLSVLVFHSYNPLKAQRSTTNYFDLPASDFLLDTGEENIYNADNTIYKGGDEYTYTYRFNKNGKNFLVYLDPEIIENGQLKFKSIIKEKDNNGVLSKLIPITHFKLVVFANTQDRTLNQGETIIKYEYYSDDKRVFYGERTSIYEDSTDLFIHPPRWYSFSFLEYFPFPLWQIRSQKGDTWEKVFMFDPKNYYYKPVEIKLKEDEWFGVDLLYENKGKRIRFGRFFKPMPVTKIHASLSNYLHNTSVDFFFSKRNGLVKGKHKSLDGFSLELTLVKKEKVK
jgi:hypothetical protein